MTKPRLWEKLHLSQWGRVKALADHLGFKVQRLKGIGASCSCPMSKLMTPSSISSLATPSPTSRLSCARLPRKNCSLGGRKS